MKIKVWFPDSELTELYRIQASNKEILPCNRSIVNGIQMAVTEFIENNKIEIE